MSPPRTPLTCYDAIVAQSLWTTLWTMATTRRSIMAGMPERHGPNGWRVRWTVRGVSRRQGCPVDDWDQGLRLKNWIEANMPILDDDPRLIYGTWNRQAAEQSAHDMTFGTYWQKINEGSSASADTRRKRDADIRLHASALLDLPITLVTRARIVAVAEAMKSKPNPKPLNGRPGYAPSMIYRVLGHIRWVMKSAHLAGFIPRDPFGDDPIIGERRLKISKEAGFDFTDPRVRSDEELYISREEWVKLLRAAASIDPQLVLILALMIETGCRIGEALALPVGLTYPDADPPYVRIESSRTPRGTVGPTKTGGKRPSAISVDLAAELAKLCRGRPHVAALFRAPRSRGDLGWRYNNWHKHRWQRLMRVATDDFGLDPSLRLIPHALRQNHVTWASEAGASPLILAKQVGHIDLLTTAHYKLDSPKSRAHMSSIVTGFVPAVAFSSEPPPE